MSRSSFFIEFIKKPRSIGSITPSSDALALGFCEAIRPYLNDKKNIIEIGGGTGTITRRLADLGKHLTVIEPNPALAQKIAAKYPKVQVVNSTIQAAIGQHISEKLLQDAVFISSLPMVSLPKKETAEIKKALFYLLKKSKDSVLFQFTYRLGNPIPFRQSTISAKRVGLVLRNIPPAHIWKYRMEHVNT